MSTPLETNTATMQAILDTVNNLPEAGSGGGASVETCTVNIINNSDETLDVYGMWVESGALEVYPTGIQDKKSTTRTAAKQSFIVIPNGNVSNIQSTCHLDEYTIDGAVIAILDDSDSHTITIS